MAKNLTSIDDLTPDSANANKGRERGANIIEKSLEQCGAGRSIVVDKNGVVIGGNKTLENWVGIGAERIRVVQTDGHELVVVQRTDLDLHKDKLARQLAINDNRAGEMSLQWDAPVLTAQIEEFGIDISSIGFTEAELAALGNEEESGGSAPKEITCPHCGSQFTPGEK